ncbi:Protein RTM1 [Cladobotryum mycophilum]|uniref:Protein RTM1 n=1 Tax=Cladobotryum mycophilum TaxID=491253 RepID=A0ABR0SYJ7_9HYPO
MTKLLPLAGTQYYAWQYVPSIPAAIIFALLFLLGTGVICWRMYKTKTLFSIPFAIGGLFEVIGYFARAAAHSHTDQLGPFVIQSILILVGPALFAASLYMTLGRLIRFIHGENHSLVRVQWLTKIFVAGDILSFLVQSSGGGLMASKTFPQKTAENIVLGGLCVQIIMFGFYAVVAIVFHRRMLRSPTPEAMQEGPKWQGILTMLYASSVFIMVRSIFRVVEYVSGNGGYPMKHEWMLYLFDAVLMVGTMVVYGWWYPGDLSPSTAKPRRQWESIDGNMEAGTYELRGGSSTGGVDVTSHQHSRR